MPSPLEQELTQKIARGGESIDMLWKDPLPSYGGDESIASADPLTLLAVAAQGAFNPPPPPEVDPFEQVAQMMTPAYLREDYSGPQTGSKVGDALAGLGQVFQSGSGAESVLGGGGTALAQVAGDLPAAGMAMGTLGGVKARGANLRMLDAAQGLEAAGAHPLDILHKTGWFKDVDGNWKFEISNDTMDLTSGAKNAFDVAKPNQAFRGKGSSILGPEDTVFQNYPELADMKMTMNKLPGMGSGEHISSGGFTPAWNAGGTSVPASLLSSANTQPALLNSITHELEHAVQNLEGWQGGGNPTAIRDMYKGFGKDLPTGVEHEIYAALLGEANARAAALRRPWTAEERARQMIEGTRQYDPRKSVLPGYFTQLTPELPIQQQLVR